MPISHLATLLAMASVAHGDTYTLEKAVATALTNSPSARMAAARLDAASSLLTQAEAAFQPRVTVSSSYLGTNQPVNVFGYALNQRSYSPSLDFNDVPDADNLNLQGLVSVPLYAGGKNTASRNEARAGVDAARHGADAVLQSLAQQTAPTWLQAHRAGSLMNAAEAAVESFEANAGLAKARLESGTGLKADLLDIGVRLAQAQEDLLRAKNARSLALQALKNLMGLENEAVDITENNPSLTMPSAGEIPKRPEVLAAEKRVEAAGFAVSRAKAGWKPSLHAFGSVDHNGGGTFDGEGTSYTAGVLVQWDLWDGKLTKGRVAEAEAALMEAREASRQLRLAVDFEVAQARLSVSDAEARQTVCAKSIALAEESVQLTRKRFEQGSALASQLIDAETALTAARVRLAEADTEQFIATVSLRRALGLHPVSNSPSAK